MYVFIKDDSFDGIGPTQEAGCAAAKKKEDEFVPQLLDTTRKILSKGQCACVVQANYYGKIYHCSIPTRLEITTPHDLDAKTTPSKGISK